MKKNTKLGKLLFYIIFLVSIIFSTLGVVANVLGIADSMQGYWTQVYTILSTYLYKLTMNSKLILCIFCLFLVATLIYWWLHKKRLERRQAREMSRFSAEQRNTVCCGGETYIFAIKQFLKQKDAPVLWWTITGVAGIGKTRLVLETLECFTFKNADVHWLESYEDYREDALKRRIDSMLDSSKLRNIIIADDAQIYMDNIGALINYIACKHTNEIGDHKIRILLLLRLGENENNKDRYHQLESKADSFLIDTLHYRSKEFGLELRVDSYTESIISEIAKSYIIKMKKKLHEKAFTADQENMIRNTVINTLKKKNMDPEHMRPLFAMCIADALISGNDPLSWSRKDALEYIVGKREEELLKEEMRDSLEKSYNRHLYEKVRGIISLSIIYNGLTISDVKRIWPQLEEELIIAGIGGMRAFFKDIQMLDKGDVIRIEMPDILAEYYVLRTLVLKSHEDSLLKIMEQLRDYLDEAIVFKKKVRQNFAYMYDEITYEVSSFYQLFFSQYSTLQIMEIIKQLFVEDDFCDVNACVLNEAINKLIYNNDDKKLAYISELLVGVLVANRTNIDGKQECLRALRHLANSKKYANDGDIPINYSKGLLCMIIDSSKLEEKRIYLSELQKLSESESFSGRNTIALKYGSGLVNMIVYAPTIDEKHKYLSILKALLESTIDADCSKNILEYCEGLINKTQYSPAYNRTDRRLWNYYALISRYGNGTMIRCVQGHFITPTSHTNYLLDMYTLKRRSSEAQNVASVICDYFASFLKINTICCLGGMDIIGAYLAEELTRAQAVNVNKNSDLNIISPEYKSNNILFFRKNMEWMVENKDIFIILPQVNTGKTLMQLFELINHYGSRVVGVFAIFSTCKVIDGISIFSLFDLNDLPDYKYYNHNDCKLCKQRIKIDAFCNDFGFTSVLA